MTDVPMRTPSDGNDVCKKDMNKVLPGKCGCNVADTDSDGDGKQDCNDACANDAEKTEPGAFGCRVLDTDMDQDGVPDCNDGHSEGGKKTELGKCGCGNLDTNSDTPDCNDQCHGCCKIAPGKCGCSMPDFDWDGNGTLDCVKVAHKMPQRPNPANVVAASRMRMQMVTISTVMTSAIRLPPRLNPANADASISTPIWMVRAWLTVLTTSVHWTQTGWNRVAAELHTSILMEMKCWIAKTSARTIPRRLHLVSVDMVQLILIPMVIVCPT